MVLNHLWGIYAHPREEWHTIEKRHESYRFSLSHIAIITIIPAIMAWFSAAKLGWSIGVGERIFLSSSEAVIMAFIIYSVLLAGIFGLTYIIHYMGKHYDSNPSWAQSLELASYTATPLFMSGLAAFYPELWFFSFVAMGALAYSIYLLYVGTPIIMRIPVEEGFVYASSIVTAAILLLVATMIATVIAWGWLFHPIYS
ncbi:Yip1 family protein [Planctobacterium marinum]|uniref:YIP1 family protein n=1 Tax=Planctobacterium marinum TaxID=1631968 RepID=A0AA48HIT2_9ALTE|nr:YIP1 family protein [Planctobacterium marinum]